MTIHHNLTHRAGRADPTVCGMPSGSQRRWPHRQEIEGDPARDQRRLNEIKALLDSEGSDDAT